MTSALDGVEWSASCPGRFTRLERAPGVHWVGGWVTSKPVWTLWRREKPLVSAGNGTPAVQPVACLYTGWAVPPHAHFYVVINIVHFSFVNNFIFKLHVIRSHHFSENGDSVFLRNVGELFHWCFITQKAKQNVIPVAVKIRMAFLNSSHIELLPVLSSITVTRGNIMCNYIWL
jgi:hypothetical protein